MKFLPDWVKSIIEAGRRWMEDDASLMAAAVSFYAALSIFPLLLVLIATLGWLMQSTSWGLDAQAQILDAVEEFASNSVREAVAGMLDQVKSDAAVGGPLGIAGLFVTATALFAHFERAFDKIWQVPTSPGEGFLKAVQNFLLQRAKAFLMLACVAVVLAVNLGAGIAVSSMRSFAGETLPGADWLWKVLQTVVSLAITTLLFGVVYWQLPKVDVPFRKALQGGVLTAVAWMLGQWVLTSLLVGDRFSAYGIIGSFIAVLAWIYYAACIVFLGAEYVQVICTTCQPPVNSGESGEAAAD